MIYDTDDNRLLSSAVDIEQGQVVEGSFRVACETGWVIAGSPVSDVICEVKHSAGAYVDIETTTIDLGTWNGTTQTFNYRLTAAASGIYRERLLPLQVRRS